MSKFRQTKVVYEAENAGTDTEEVLVDMLLNLEHVAAILPGKRPGTLTVVMENRIRYTIKDNIKGILGAKV